MATRADIIMLSAGVTLDDVRGALRRAGLVVGPGAFPTVSVISRAPSRFPRVGNVIDLAPDHPARRPPLRCERAGFDLFNGSPDDAA